MTDVNRVFKVKGKPFYPLGGEFLYVSGYSIRDESQTDEAFKAVNLAHGNTALIPVYWDQVEPKEGTYDFTSVDALLASARRNGVKLILLWFATWKNGNMDFAPGWVKTNPQRYKRVISSAGNTLWVLSSHCPANLEADKKAFTALCKHLKAIDSTEQTVIGIQIENEPGIYSSDRDYGPEAQAEFNSPVPAKLVTAMKAAGKGRVYDLWQQAGGKKSGTWPELFGWEAGELMTAWSIATYIDAVAEVGKATYDIPMLINVALLETQSRGALYSLPGQTYASGGGVSKVLDIYKWVTPHIDIIAPDIYIPDTKGFESLCTIYARDDNPLFVPESLGGTNMLRAIADYNAVGYAVWLRSPAADGSLPPDARMNIHIVRCVASIITLLLTYQGTGKIHTVIEEEGMTTQRFDFEGYLGRAAFGQVQSFNRRRDQDGSLRGWGLVIQASRNAFYMVGDNYQLFLQPKAPPEKLLAAAIRNDYSHDPQAQYLSVDEGHFDRNGDFIVECQRNGDQISRGLWVESQIGVLRARMCD